MKDKERNARFRRGLKTRKEVRIMIKLSINNRYYFDEQGNAFIPSIQELIEYYKLVERVYIIKEPFPYEGYGIVGCGGSYKTKEEAKEAVEKVILNEAEYYRQRAKIL